MDPLSAIMAFAKSLPELIALANRLGDVFDRFTKWTGENNLNKWITDFEKSMDELEKADTDEKKVKALKDIVGSIRDL